MFKKREREEKAEWFKSILSGVEMGAKSRVQAGCMGKDAFPVSCGALFDF